MTKKTQSLLIIIFSALALRLIFALVYSPRMTTDSASYEVTAINLIAGNGYSDSVQPPHEHNFFRAPSYPFFIALIYKIFGAHRQALFFIQQLLGIMTACLIYLIATRGLEEKWARVTGVVVALHPILAFYETLVLTETFFIFVFSLSIFLIVREISFKNFALAGLFLGIATLTKPIAQFLPVLVIIWLLITRVPFKNAVKAGFGLMTAFVVVISPWLIYNKINFNYIGFAPAGGISYVQLTAPLWEGVAIEPYADIKERVLKLKIEVYPHTDFVEPFTEDYNNLRKQGLSPIEINSLYADLFKKTILAQPLGYAKLIFKNVGLYYNGYNSISLMSRDMSKKFSQNFSDRDYPEIVTKIFARFLLPPVIWSLTLVGVFFVLKNQNKIGFFWILLIIYFTGLTSAAVPAYDRYRMPIEPFLLLLAVYGLKESKNLLSQWRQNKVTR